MNNLSTLVILCVSAKCLFNECANLHQNVKTHISSLFDQLLRSFHLVALLSCYFSHSSPSSVSTYLKMKCFQLSKSAASPKTLKHIKAWKQTRRFVYHLALTLKSLKLAWQYLLIHGCQHTLFFGFFSDTI